VFAVCQSSSPEHFLYDPESIASRQLMMASAAVAMAMPRTEADQAVSQRGSSAVTVSRPDAQLA